MGETREQLQRRFEALLEGHRGIVLKVARLYAPDPYQRQDLAQEIRYQLWRAFPRFDPTRRFSTWMYRVALNVGISHLRREQRRRHSETALQEEQLASLAAAEPDERQAQLWSFIDSLDEYQRSLVLLYLDERSYAEIAEILGISETNVATKLARIKQKMRGQLAPTTAPTTEA